MLTEIDSVRVVMHDLAVDAVAAEVCSAMRANGVRPLLLKGPSLAEWLYTEGVARPYGDIDLLVGRERLETAERMLTTLGFELKTSGLSPLEEGPHARCWTRGGISVDLHSTVWYAGVAPEKVWAYLTDETEFLRVGGVELEVLAKPARALLVALHAAHHGMTVQKPRQDLKRAVDQAPFEVWRRATELARAIHAELAMAAGLRLDPEGALLVDKLGLPQESNLLLTVRSGHPPPGAVALATLLATRGPVGKGRYIARKLVPTCARMRQRSSRGIRHRPLAVAYLQRPLILLVRLPPCVLTLIRARSTNRRLRAR